MKPRVSNEAACRACGAQVASTAVRCDRCGAVDPSDAMDRTLVGTTVVGATPAAAPETTAPFEQTLVGASSPGISTPFDRTRVSSAITDPGVPRVPTRPPQPPPAAAPPSAQQETVVRAPSPEVRAQLASPDLEQRDSLIGQSLGEYRVEARIGVGGMGYVYRAVQPLIGKSVAVKVLRPEIEGNAENVQRFLNEARVVNAIGHRGIIDIFSFGKLPDGRHYFVMEYLSGTALDAYIDQRGVIPSGEAVRLLEEICDALGAAHQAGVIHRDLKPHNIFLVQQSSGQMYVKILDFGLAKQSPAQDLRTVKTMAGLVVGTPEYLAPEQARADKVTPRTDLYSLGVMAFQMLTGVLPFDAESPMQFFFAHLQAPPKIARQLNPSVPEPLSNLIARLLAKEPEDRPQSAEDVRAELQEMARTFTAAPSRGSSGLHASPVRRGPVGKAPTLDPVRGVAPPSGGEVASAPAPQSSPHAAQAASEAEAAEADAEAEAGAEADAIPGGSRPWMFWLLLVGALLVGTVLAYLLFPSPPTPPAR